MKETQKSAMTTNSNTITNANPQISMKTKMSQKKFLKIKEELEQAQRQKEHKERIGRMNKVNALYSSMQREFDKMYENVSATDDAASIHKKYDDNYTLSNVTGMQLLTDDVVDIPKLVEPILHRVGIAALVGSSDTGKSTLLRHLAICIVTGRKFLDWDVKPIHKRALYVSTEDDQMAISSLLKKQNLDYQLKPEELENLVFIFDTDNLLARLEKELQEKPADLIIIDAFADLFTAELYKTNEVRAFLNNYNQLAQRYGCLIIFLHHTKKAAEEMQPSKNNSLGSQGFEAKMRLLIELKSNLQNPQKKHVCIVKGNYLPSDFKTKSFDVEFTDNLTFTSLGTRTPFDKLNSNEVSLQTLETEYNEIISLKEQGLTYREIGLKFGVSHVTIIRKIKTFEKLKNAETRVNNKN